MGSIYDSFSIPGNVHKEARGQLITWLGAKGFDLVECPQFIEPDLEYERGVIIYWNHQRTVVLYSHAEEDQRLLFELEKLGKPVLHLWLYDSSIWGYELFHENKLPSAFTSNSRYSGILKKAEAPNDVETLCRVCGIPGYQYQRRIRKLQRKKSIFKDEICDEFAALLGVLPAASCYLYALEEPGTAKSSGYHVEELLFRDRGWDPMATFDIHRINVDIYDNPGDDDFDNEKWQDIANTLGNEIAQRLPGENKTHHTKVAARGISFILKPFKVLKQAIWWIKSYIKYTIYVKIKTPVGIQPRKILVKNAKEQGDHRPFRSEGDYLINDSHGCRIRLAKGAEPEMAYDIFSRFYPVFAFRVGEIELFCSALRPEQARFSLENFPSSPDTKIREENREIGGLPVKSTYSSGNRNGQYIVNECHFIQGPRAVYEFSFLVYEDPTPEEVETIRETINSFEFISGQS